LTEKQMIFNEDVKFTFLTFYIELNFTQLPTNSIRFSDSI